MEEKKERSIAVFIIIIILVAIISSVTTMIVYGNILNSKGEEYLVESIKEDLENLQEEEATTNSSVESDFFEDD